MFLRQTRRTKDGKTHSYWSVVENQRLDGGRVVQHPVLYLGGDLFVQLNDKLWTDPSKTVDYANLVSALL